MEARSGANGYGSSPARKGCEGECHRPEGWDALVLGRLFSPQRYHPLLLEKGADVNAKNKHEDNALIHGRLRGDMDTVRCCSIHHADRKRKGRHGKDGI